jgi:hypothetical protein
MIRTTTRSIWAKDGRVIAPMTKIDVLRWPENGWRLAFLVDEPRQRIVTISEQDLEACTQRVPA